MVISNSATLRGILHESDPGYGNSCSMLAVDATVAIYQLDTFVNLLTKCHQLNNIITVVPSQFPLPSVPVPSNPAVKELKRWNDDVLSLYAQCNQLQSLRWLGHVPHTVSPPLDQYLPQHCHG
jgi:hypothetical protein